MKLTRLTVLAFFYATLLVSCHIEKYDEKILIEELYINLKEKFYPSNIGSLHIVLVDNSCNDYLIVNLTAGYYPQFENQANEKFQNNNTKFYIYYNYPKLYDWKTYTSPYGGSKNVLIKKTKSEVIYYELIIPDHDIPNPLN